jgi:hypothetical protein
MDPREPSPSKNKKTSGDDEEHEKKMNNNNDINKEWIKHIF